MTRPQRWHLYVVVPPADPKPKLASVIMKLWNPRRHNKRPTIVVSPWFDHARRAAERVVLSAIPLPRAATSTAALLPQTCNPYRLGNSLTLPKSNEIIWGMADLSTLQRIVVGGLLAVLLVAMLSGCSGNVRRFDYPVFNLEGSSESTHATHPATGSTTPPSPQP